ncbi:MAG: HAMP domain-containing protein, partial [Pseudomonadaceae bacterium]|nr:HAMP domain-containing protein [Pseudomonadaceae bacterium]
MATWLSDLSLKYKFWAVNAVACVTLLLLVLYAMHIDQQAASNAAQQTAEAQAQVLKAWPAEQPLPKAANLLSFASGERPVLAGVDTAQLARAQGWVELNARVNGPAELLIGAVVINLGSNQKLALLAYAPSFVQVFRQQAVSYAWVVCILMLVLMASSQLLIRFLLAQLNNLKDMMLQVAKSGDLTKRMSRVSADEVGQMASAFNAMQSSF